jgi:hypothetical protein
MQHVMILFGGYMIINVIEVYLRQSYHISRQGYKSQSKMKRVYWYFLEVRHDQGQVPKQKEEVTFE